MAVPSQAASLSFIDSEEVMFILHLLVRNACWVTVATPVKLDNLTIKIFN